MNPLLLPRPRGEWLATQPLHVVVRDYPEVLERLRARSVSPTDLGERTARDLDPDGELLRELEASTAWRPASEEPRGA